MKLKGRLEGTVVGVIVLGAAVVNVMKARMEVRTAVDSFIGDIF